MSVFTSELLDLAVLVVVCLLAGTCLLAFASEHVGEALGPSTLGIGAAVLVVAGHWISRIVGFERVSLPLVVTIVLGSGVVLLVRRGALRPLGRTVGISALLMLSAMPATALYLSTQHGAETRGLRFPSVSNDAFFYVGVDDWFQAHPVTDAPDRSGTAASPDGPADDVAAQYMEAAKRWGEATLQGVAGSVSRGQTSDRWGVVVAGWLLTVPGAIASLACGLGASRRAALRSGVVGGLVVATTGSVVGSLLLQNSTFVLGLGMGILAAAGILLLAGERELRPVDLVVVGLLVAGWLGSYFEYVVPLAPLVVGGLLAARRVPWAGLAKRLGWLSLIVLVSGPFIVANAVSGLLFLGGTDSPWPNWYWGVPWQQSIGRIVGTVGIADTTTPDTGGRTTLTVVLTAAWVLLFAIAIVWRRIRLPLLLVLVMTGGVWVLSAPGPSDYAANRLVAMTVPVVMALVLVGVLAATDLDWTWRGLLRSLAAAGVAVLVVGTVIATRSLVEATSDAALPGRSITEREAEAVEWVRELGAPRGDGVVVATENYAMQLILGDRLRTLPDVGWAWLWPGYFIVRTFPPLSRPRYVLTDANAAILGDLDVVRSNDRWQLIDLSGRGAVVTSGMGGPSTGQPTAEQLTGAEVTKTVVLGEQCSGVDASVTTADGRPAFLRWGFGADPFTSEGTDVLVEAAPVELALEAGNGFGTLRLVPLGGSPIVYDVATWIPVCS